MDMDHSESGTKITVYGENIFHNYIVCFTCPHPTKRDRHSICIIYPHVVYEWRLSYFDWRLPDVNRGTYTALISITQLK